jgi:glycosyltransferase involved in cell wall biosynthesis
MFILPFTIKKNQYDWLFLPAGNRRLMLFYPIKTLITMLDLSQFNVEKKYDTFRMFYIKHVIPFFLKRADLIFAISQNTANDLVKHYNMKPEDIIVNHIGTNTEHFLQKERLNPNPLGMPYILYVARIEHPGKNHLNLIKAYEKLPDSLKASYRLCLVGSDWNGAEAVHEYADTSADRERIIFSGFVDNEDLIDYYQHASLFAFPSFYEGFGLPVAEAMACGTPVITSNVSSLPEVGGDAVVYVDPNNIEDIKEKIIMILNDEDLQKQMIENGLKRAKEFTWEKSAKKHMEVFQKVLK